MFLLELAADTIFLVRRNLCYACVKLVQLVCRLLTEHTCQGTLRGLGYITPQPPFTIF